MKPLSVSILGGLAVFGLLLPAAENPIAAISIDYPADGSIFPPEIIAPTFLWRDSDARAVIWQIDVGFADGSPALRVRSKGGPMPIGEIDERCAAAGAVPPTLTPQEAVSQSWKPDTETWAAIKAHSVRRAATVTITGFRDAEATVPVSRGRIGLVTSKDPVGAPIFYRDVPLVPPPIGEKGIIMPLPKSAVPLIAWRLLYIGEARPKLMMQGLPTCANCHSFSHDGKTLGLDVDGPANDKGLYGLVPIATRTSFAGVPSPRSGRASDSDSCRRSRRTGSTW